jgi:hypothetical protein
VAGDYRTHFNATGLIAAVFKLFSDKDRKAYPKLLQMKTKMYPWGPYNNLRCLLLEIDPHKKKTQTMIQNS